MNTQQLNQLGWFMTPGNPRRAQHRDGRTLERADNGVWMLDDCKAMAGRTVGEAATEAEALKTRKPQKVGGRA